MSKKDTPVPEKSSFQSLFTRQTANAGREMPIKTIDGKDTGEWLLVLGSESDTWEAIKADFYRERIKSESSEEVKIDITGMVAGWSFKEECSTDNIRALFDNAPYISDAVDVFSRIEANLVKKD